MGNSGERIIPSEVWLINKAHAKPCFEPVPGQWYIPVAEIGPLLSAVPVPKPPYCSHGFAFLLDVLDDAEIEYVFTSESVSLYMGEHLGEATGSRGDRSDLLAIALQSLYMSVKGLK